MAEEQSTSAKTSGEAEEENVCQENITEKTLSVADDAIWKLRSLCHIMKPLLNNGRMAMADDSNIEEDLRKALTLIQKCRHRVDQILVQMLTPQERTLLQAGSATGILSSQPELDPNVTTDSGVLFRACQTFVHVTARRLAASPAARGTKADILYLLRSSAAEDREKQKVEEIQALWSRSVDQYGVHQDSTAKEVIEALIRAVRQKENSPQFHCRLLRDQLFIARKRGEKTDNFAYGSTSFELWSLPFCSQDARLWVADCKMNHRSYCVFGSSSGLLVFYGRLWLGLRSVGYEILPFLVQEAENLRRAREVDDVCFLLQDMLCADLGQVGIVLLASLCWEEALATAVRHKLENELMPAALVVDYTSSLSLSSAFRLLQSFHGRVSWTKKQTLFLYQKM